MSKDSTPPLLRWQHVIALLAMISGIFFGVPNLIFGCLNEARARSKDQGASPPSFVAGGNSSHGKVEPATDQKNLEPPPTKPKPGGVPKGDTRKEKPPDTDVPEPTTGSGSAPSPTGGETAPKEVTPELKIQSSFTYIGGNLAESIDSLEPQSIVIAVKGKRETIDDVQLSVTHPPILSAGHSVAILVKGSRLLSFNGQPVTSLRFGDQNEELPVDSNGILTKNFVTPFVQRGYFLTYSYKCPSPALTMDGRYTIGEAYPEMGKVEQNHSSALVFGVDPESTLMWRASGGLQMRFKATHLEFFPSVSVEVRDEAGNGIGASTGNSGRNLVVLGAGKFEGRLSKVAEKVTLNLSTEWWP